MKRVHGIGFEVLALLGMLFIAGVLIYEAATYHGDAQPYYDPHGSICILPAHVYVGGKVQARCEAGSPSEAWAVPDLASDGYVRITMPRRLVPRIGKWACPLFTTCYYLEITGLRPTPEGKALPLPVLEDRFSFTS